MGRVCRPCRWQGDEHDDGRRAHAGQPAKGPDLGPAHRAHRRRRSSHLRHGQPVPADRHLQPRRPVLRARGSGDDAVLPRDARRAAAGGRHQRGRRAEQLDRRRHQLQRARAADAAGLHLLLDVRLPARRRLDLGRCRPEKPGLPARRHIRPHDVGRRRPSASGWQQPAGGQHRAQLRGLGSCARGRGGGDPRTRHAAHAGGAAR